MNNFVIKLSKKKNIFDKSFIIYKNNNHNAGFKRYCTNNNKDKNDELVTNEELPESLKNFEKPLNIPKILEDLDFELAFQNIKQNNTAKTINLDTDLSEFEFSDVEANNKNSFDKEISKILEGIKKKNSNEDSDTDADIFGSDANSDFEESAYNASQLLNRETEFESNAIENRSANQKDLHLNQVISGTSEDDISDGSDIDKKIIEQLDDDAIFSDEESINPENNMISIQRKRVPYLNKSKLGEKYIINAIPKEGEERETEQQQVDLQQDGRDKFLDTKNYELAEKLELNQVTRSKNLIETPIQQIPKMPVIDVQTLVSKFKSKNEEIEENKMQKQKVTRYFDQEPETPNETEEQFLMRYQKFMNTSVNDIFLPNSFDINKELARPVFIGSKRKDFTKEKLLKSFKRSLPLIRNHPQQLEDSFLSLVYFCTSEVADNWEDHQYLNLASEIFRLSKPSQQESLQLVSQMQERLNKHYKNKPEKAQRLLMEYKKSLKPQTFEEIERDNQKLYEEHPELKPVTKKQVQVNFFEDDFSKKTFEDEFLGLNTLHLTELNDNPRLNFWYGLDEEKFKSVLPEGYPSLSFLNLSVKTLQSVDCTHVYSLMWTKSCQDLLNNLKKRQNERFLRLKSDNKKGGIVLNGKKGVGKTAVLAEMVMWARLNGWIVVYLDGRDLTETGYIEPSKKDRNLFDQPNVAAKLCKDQLDVHSDKLSKLLLKGNVSPLVADALKPTETTTLEDLLKFGVANPMQATEMFEEYRMQLNSVTEFPVLIAVDSIDRLHSLSNFTDRLSLSYNPKRIHANRLIIPRLFADYDNHGLINGTFIGALTTGKPKIEWLKKFGHKDLYYINTWNLTELSSSMEFWKKINYMRELSANRAVYQYYHTLASGIGSELFRLAKPL